MTILSSLRQLFKSPFDDKDAHALYVEIVRQSRLPVFYETFGVQDTPEGRFDLLAIHTYLVLRRLQHERERTAELAQALFDLMFADLDQNLREMGYGDTGVAKRIKKMAEAFYGRIKAYDEGLDALKGNSATDDCSAFQVLEQALDRNLYRNTSVTADNLTIMARYVHKQAQHLETQGIGDLMAGILTLCPLVGSEGDRENGST